MTGICLNFIIWTNPKVEYHDVASRSRANNNNICLFISSYCFQENFLTGDYYNIRTYILKLSLEGFCSIFSLTRLWNFSIVCLNLNYFFMTLHFAREAKTILGGENFF